MAQEVSPEYAMAEEEIPYRWYENPNVLKNEAIHGAFAGVGLVAMVVEVRLGISFDKALALNAIPGVAATYFAARADTKSTIDTLEITEEAGELGISTGIHEHNPEFFGWSSQQFKSSKKAKAFDILTIGAGVFLPWATGVVGSKTLCILNNKRKGIRARRAIDTRQQPTHE